MKTLRFITLFLLLIHPVSALTNVISILNGEKLITTVSSDKLKQSPAWSPKEGEPPISPVQALKLVSKSVIEHFPMFTRYSIRSIDLTRSTSGSWHYKVTLYKMPSKEEFERAGGHLKPDTLIFFVLLDGSVIHPIRRA